MQSFEIYWEVDKDGVVPLHMHTWFSALRYAPSPSWDDVKSSQGRRCIEQDGWVSVVRSGAHKKTFLIGVDMSNRSTGVNQLQRSVRTCLLPQPRV